MAELSLSVIEIDAWMCSHGARYPAYLLKEILTQLRRKKLTGTPLIKQTVNFLTKLVGSVKGCSTAELMINLKIIGVALMATDPLELSLGNLVRRVLNIIREAYSEIALENNKETNLEDSSNMRERMERVTSLSTLTSMVVSNSLQDEFLGQFDKQLRDRVNEDIGELIQAELENSVNLISEYAQDHIHTNEIILTFGISNTVLEFLKAAQKKGRDFEVFVAESAPQLYGHQAAKNFALANIKCTVINDSAVFAIMARVNKVVIGTHAVMANGGLIAYSGGHMIAVAAKAHSVPVIVCTGLYKLTPLYPYDQDSFNSFNSPGAVLAFEEWNNDLTSVNVVNPAYDYIPPDLVDLLITNGGCNPPSYVYRLLQESYSPKDHIL